jgi:hypothetical protein
VIEANIVVNLIDDLRIERGCFWSPLTILLFGDYTDWELFGQIRDQTGSESLYADFQFEPIVLVDRVEDEVTKTYSRIVPFLGASQSLAIPPTKIISATTPIAIGKNRWAFDIRIRNPDDLEIVLPICEGAVEVSDRVTVIV